MYLLIQSRRLVHWQYLLAGLQLIKAAPQHQFHESGLVKIKTMQVISEIPFTSHSICHPELQEPLTVLWGFMEEL